MNLKDLHVLRLDMIQAKNRFNNEADLYAEKHCGVYVGDVIEVTGISHRGKIMRVTHFSLEIDNWKNEYFAVIHGIVLKQNGEDSKNSAITSISLGVV